MKTPRNCSGLGDLDDIAQIDIIIISMRQYKARDRNEIQVQVEQIRHVTRRDRKNFDDVITCDHD